MVQWVSVYSGTMSTRGSACREMLAGPAQSCLWSVGRSGCRLTCGRCRECVGDEQKHVRPRIWRGRGVRVLCRDMAPLYDGKSRCGRACIVVGVEFEEGARVCVVRGGGGTQARRVLACCRVEGVSRYIRQWRQCEGSYLNYACEAQLEGETRAARQLLSSATMREGARCGVRVCVEICGRGQLHAAVGLGSAAHSER
ncbi:hypothetical protein K466DRAFT_45064 [Polyporus arcularius HHB13444]|uniref:Uncharacterized protein n=1 Tax=Polyporus arcularius HHB13444 TaxID=1314778 RepID=A0A5C3NMQ4_9APHY|nr:hypothetical protein K466DRAFT_45064 [Polyporus arcularius HHB13444]